MPLVLLEKIIIKTDIRGANLPKNSEKEDMQVLTIDISGDICVEKYSYDYIKKNFDLIDQYDYELDTVRIFNIVDLLENYFDGNKYLPVSKEGPHCILEFYYNVGDKNQSYRFDLLEDDELSRIVRQILLNYDLFVFDGKKNYDHIEKIVLNYQRTIKLISDSTDQVSYKGIREELEVDKETVTIKRNLEDGTAVEFTCKIPDKLADFIEYLENAEVFYYMENLDENLFYDPDDKNYYELSLFYEKKGTLITDGTYDKRNLPYFFSVFIGNLAEILAKSAIPDIFDPSIYGKMVRSESDFIYLLVEFSPDGESYYYRTEDDGIDVGDQVIVPVGNHGREAVVEVIDKEYFAYENLPFPLEETKMIIEKIFE